MGGLPVASSSSHSLRGRSELASEIVHRSAQPCLGQCLESQAFPFYLSLN